MSDEHMLTKAEFYKEMANLEKVIRDSVREEIEPVTKLATLNNKDIAVLQKEQESQDEKIEDNKDANKKADVFNFLLAILATIIGGMGFGQK